MKKLIAIGGGEIGRPGTKVETLAIDKEIIKLTGKKHPKLLFIPTATKDWPGYVEAVQKYFGKKLGCKISTLLVVSEKPGFKLIREKILGADVIYVGGGNTLQMLKWWRRLGIDKVLWEAHKKGIVISGLSAGAICWFKFGTSDSRMISNPNFKGYIRVKGLGWYNLTFSPHHIREKQRKAELIKQIIKHGGVGLALDDFAAIEFIDNKFKIITSKQFAKAHKVYIKDKKLFYAEIEKNKFLDLEYLIKE